jgi:Spy/CpxP family protein refolding chaperone
MKKLIVAAFLVAGLSTFAQVEKKEKEKEKSESREKLSPEERTQRELKRMTKALNLSDAQQKEMTALFSEMQSKRAENQGKPSKEDRKAMKDKVNKILTTEQAATWEKIQDERKEKMKEKKEGKTGEK